MKNWGKKLPNIVLITTVSRIEFQSRGVRPCSAMNKSLLIVADEKRIELKWFKLTITCTKDWSFWRLHSLDTRVTDIKWNVFFLNLPLQSHRGDREICRAFAFRWNSMKFFLNLKQFFYTEMTLNDAHDDAHIRWIMIYNKKNNLKSSILIWEQSLQVEKINQWHTFISRGEGTQYSNILNRREEEYKCGRIHF